MDRGRAISEPLRKAIQASPESRYRIAKETGIAGSVLSRFVRGEQGITLETADVLAVYLGLELVQKSRDVRRKVEKGG